jgi:hypothetical protein
MYTFSNEGINFHPPLESSFWQEELNNCPRANIHLFVLMNDLRKKIFTC